MHKLRPFPSLGGIGAKKRLPPRRSFRSAGALRSHLRRCFSLMCYVLQLFPGGGRREKPVAIGRRLKPSTEAHAKQGPG